MPTNIASIKHVRLVEVGPRDGLQNEHTTVPTATKIAWIHALAHCGLSTIEATSFVSPSRVPQLADAHAVLQGLDLPSHIATPVLVPNTIGLQRAIEAGARSIAVITAATDGFCQHNTHCSQQDSMARIQAIVREATQRNIPTRAYISCAMGCPYDGKVDPNRVADIAAQCMAMGCDEIALGDTIGVGTAGDTDKLLTAVCQVVPVEQIAMHCHDTYGQALTNLYVALQHGVTTFDTAIGGLGGCPYAPGASGNVATEDVVYLLEGLGIDTGVNLDRLIQCSLTVCQYLKNTPRSHVTLATMSSTPKKHN